MQLKTLLFKTPPLKILLCALAITASGGASAQTSTPYDWDSMAMGGGGFVSGIIPSKSEQGLVYARTDVGGAYRWDKTKNRWVSLMDWVSENETGLLGIESLAVDPNNAAKVYLLAGISYFNNGKTVILRSNDYGKTFAMTDVSTQFKAHGNGMGRQSGEKLQVDPGSSNILYTGTRRNGLFKSTDSGASWKRVASLDVTSTPNDNGISFVLLDPTSVSGGEAQRIFVGISRFGSVGPNLYFSYDAGETFIPVEGAPSAFMPQRAVISPDGLMYITYANGAGPYGTTAEPMNNGQIWEYDAAGGNWTNVTPAGLNRPFGGISIDPNNPNHLIASTINTYLLQFGNTYGDRILTSKNAGRTWVDVVARGFALDPKGISWITNSSIHWAGSIEFDPFDTNSAWVTSGNGIFKSSNLEATKNSWAFEVAGLEETVPRNAVSIPNGPFASVIFDYDGFMQTNPAEYGTIHTPRMGTTTGIAIASLDTSIMARVGNAVYYSTNTGASWSKSPAINGKEGQVALSADGKVLLHSPTGSTVSYRSTDFGSSWTAITGLSVNNARPTADPINPNVFYAYSNGTMLISTDGGASFAAKGTLGSGGSNIIRLAPGMEGHIWAPLYGGGLSRSTNSGATFSKLANVSYCGAVGFGKAAAGADYPTIYIWGTVSGVLGVHRSTDKGATWTRVNDDAHEYGGPANGQFVMGDMNTFGLVYMSTAGRGIVYGKPVANSNSSSSASSSSSSSSSSTSSASSVSSSSSSSSSAPVNKCSYVVTATWNGGYNAAIRITNNRSTVINGWKVNWTYSDNSVLQGSWNAAVTGTAPSYSAVPNQTWNKDIYPGATVEFGITVSGAAIPTVTGDACN